MEKKNILENAQKHPKTPATENMIPVQRMKGPTRNYFRGVRLGSGCELAARIENTSINRHTHVLLYCLFRKPLPSPYKFFVCRSFICPICPRKLSPHNRWKQIYTNPPTCISHTENLLIAYIFIFCYITYFMAIPSIVAVMLTWWPIGKFCIRLSVGSKTNA